MPDAAQIRTIAETLEPAALAALLAGGARLAPLVRAICETVLGARMAEEAAAMPRPWRIANDGGSEDGQRGVPEALAREIVEAREAGMSVKDIAFCVDLSDSTVKRVCARARSDAAAAIRRLAPGSGVPGHGSPAGLSLPGPGKVRCPGPGVFTGRRNLTRGARSI